MGGAGRGTAWTVHAVARPGYDLVGQRAGHKLAGLWDGRVMG